MTVSLGAASLISSEEFSYGADPVVDSVSPDCTLLEGEDIVCASLVIRFT